jgi:predicted RNase H-like nuclease
VIALGADGSPGGAWLVAELTDDGGPPRLWDAPHTEALLQAAEELGADAVALDVPIGLPDDGLRACDVAARALLTGGGSSSVFAAPTRRVLAATTYAEGRALQPSLSAQSFALVPRIREVDAALRARGSAVHDRVVECHPEVVFRRLAGAPLLRKKSAGGALQRIALLTEALGALPRTGPPHAALDDALDALACAWTARRWAFGQADVLGGEHDSTDTPMRIVR